MDFRAIRKPRGIQRAAQRLGYGKGRNLFWSWYEPRNFGDWIGPYLFLKMTGMAPQWVRPRRGVGRPFYITVGSVLRHVTVPDEAIVWGSGIISETDRFARPLETHAVRGPRTRKRMLDLGYECPEIYGDPAVVLPKYFCPQEAAPDYKVGIIPHYMDLSVVRDRVAEGVLLVDVTQAVEDVIRDIRRCEWSISSSLHGVIVSHAYGVPSVWVDSVTKLHGNGVKFSDYFEGAGLLGVEPSEVDLSASERDLAVTRDLATLPDLTRQRAELLASCPYMTGEMQ